MFGSLTKNIGKLDMGISDKVARFSHKITSWVTAVLLVSSNASVAAEFAIDTEASFGADRCRITLSGEIVDGDAARLLDVLKENQIVSFNGGFYSDSGGAPELCLNSPGGSLSTAIEIADIVHRGIATKILSDEECLSACAIIFMAGIVNTEKSIGRLISRELHVGGRLGFHAPQLSVASGEYNKEVVDLAYNIAVNQSGEIFSRLSKFSIAPSLITAMYLTPPDQMLFVETVNQAIQWEIGLQYGVNPATSVIDDIAAYNICFNTPRQHTDSSDPSDWKFGGFYGYGEVVRKSGRDGYNRPVEIVTLKSTGRDGASDECRIEAPAILERQRFSDPAYGIGYKITVQEWPNPLVEYDLRPVMLTRPGTLLRQLSSASFDQRNMTGKCFVYALEEDWIEGVRQLTKIEKLDDEACRLESKRFSNGGVIQTFTWPTTNKTILDFRGGQMKLNGQPVWPLSPALLPSSNLDFCVQSSKTRRHFCFSSS